jgi:hypothetical protein
MLLAVLTSTRTRYLSVAIPSAVLLLILWVRFATWYWVA